jgi:hypothetical protein
LFLISKGSESLHTYLDSDFAIVAHVVECEPEGGRQAEAKESDRAMEMESGPEMVASTTKGVPQEEHDELKAKYESLMRDFEASRANFEAMEKMVNDRDR